MIEINTYIVVIIQSVHYNVFRLHFLIKKVVELKIKYSEEFLSPDTEHVISNQ